MFKRTLFPLLVALAVLGLRAAPPVAHAEDAATGNYSAAELKELVGPVALYPDMVVASLLPATTFPTQITEAAALLASKGGTVTEVPADTTWDSSVQALLQYPDLLVWLSGNPDWVAQMGFAVANQQSDVLASIQDFRLQAQTAGNLTSDSHQIVTTQDSSDGGTQVIVIQPADPAVVYVPTYSPVAVVQPGYVWPWGVGFAMGVTGAIIANNIGWGNGWGNGGGSININNSNNVNINRGGNTVNNIGNGNNIGNDVGPNRPSKFNPSNKPTQRPAGGVAQPKPGGWGSATGAPKGNGVKPRPPASTLPARPGAGNGPGAGYGPGAGNGPGAGTGPRPGAGNGPGAGTGPGAGPGARPTPAPARPGPGAARPTPSPAPRPSPSGGFGGAGNGATTRAASDRGGSSLKASGGGASGGGSFKGQSGRSSGGGGGRSGGGGGGRSGGGGGRRR